MAGETLNFKIQPSLYDFRLFYFQVLYKSRCDNSLNEITERAIADKREVLPKICKSVCLIYLDIMSLISD